MLINALAGRSRHSERSEESAFGLDTREKQIPRFARNDKNRLRDYFTSLNLSTRRPISVSAT
jgi:hypothetical protein